MMKRAELAPTTTEPDTHYLECVSRVDGQKEKARQLCEQRASLETRSKELRITAAKEEEELCAQKLRLLQLEESHKQLRQKDADASAERDRLISNLNLQDARLDGMVSIRRIHRPGSGGDS